MQLSEMALKGDGLRRLMGEMQDSAGYLPLFASVLQADLFHLAGLLKICCMCISSSIWLVFWKYAVCVFLLPFGWSSENMLYVYFFFHLAGLLKICCMCIFSSIWLVFWKYAVCLFFLPFSWSSENMLYVYFFFHLAGLLKICCMFFFSSIWLVFWKYAVR